jgi:hypothetical protein
MKQDGCLSFSNPNSTLRVKIKIWSREDGQVVKRYNMAEKMEGSMHIVVNQVVQSTVEE